MALLQSRMREPKRRTGGAGMTKAGEVGRKGVEVGVEVYEQCEEGVEVSDEIEIYGMRSGDEDAESGGASVKDTAGVLL